MFISVVITTYNRVGLVRNAIHSVFSTLSGVEDFEVVVVDDASTDDTASNLRSLFGDVLASGKLKLLENDINVGVTGSKNRGYLASAGDWVVFLDSDDILLPEAGRDMVAALYRYSNIPLVFFRCVDHNNKFVGQRFHSDVQLTIETYLAHTSFGEALTAVNRNIVKQIPYIEELRGNEGIGCCRIIDCYGAGVLCNIVARQYDKTGDDRLSVFAGLFNRMPLIARGHLILVREFGSRMHWCKAVNYYLKAFVYTLIGRTYQFIKGIIE